MYFTATIHVRSFAEGAAGDTGSFYISLGIEAPDLVSATEIAKREALRVGPDEGPIHGVVDEAELQEIARPNSSTDLNGVFFRSGRIFHP